METIDFNRLKTGEVNLGVCFLFLLPKAVNLTSFLHRLRLWPSSSRTELSLVQTVEQPQEATSCVPTHPDLFERFSLIVFEIQANRVTDKLTHVHDRIYCCRSGSAADTQAIADVVHYHMQQFTYGHFLFICYSSDLPGVISQSTSSQTSPGPCSCRPLPEVLLRK